MLLHDCDYSELASILKNPDINVNEFDENGDAAIHLLKMKNMSILNY